MSDERQQQPSESGEGVQEPQAPAAAPGENQQAAPQEEEKTGGRFDAAKAFFRALHAGADELPDLGISGAPESERSGPCRNCKFLESEVAETKQKLQESENLYKRMMADFENFRRRVDRERDELQAVGIQRTVENLLPALDDMERANASLNADMPAEKLLESVKLVFNRLSRCLESVGVKALAVVGEHFDPKFHEPVQEVETTEVPHGAVVHELRRGYTLNDKVIRPALVNVACNPATEGTAATGESETVEAESVQPAPSGGEPAVYDLSSIEDSQEAEEALKKKLDEYLETPASGNRTVDE